MCASLTSVAFKVMYAPEINPCRCNICWYSEVQSQHACVHPTIDLFWSDPDDHGPLNAHHPAVTRSRISFGTLRLKTVYVICSWHRRPAKAERLDRPASVINCQLRHANLAVSVCISSLVLYARTRAVLSARLRCRARRRRLSLP